MKAIFTKSYAVFYLPVIGLIVFFMLAIWTRHQYLCCELHIGWSIVLQFACSLCGGWIGYTWLMRKRGKI